MEIKIERMCDNCLSVKSCKYVDDIQILFGSSKFYDAFSTSNGLMRNFKEYAGKHCSFYHKSFNLGKMDDNTPKNVVEYAISKYMKESNIDWTGGSISRSAKSELDHEWTLKDGIKTTSRELAKDIELI